jgi:hypothetical protein
MFDGLCVCAHIAPFVRLLFLQSFSSTILSLLQEHRKSETASAFLSNIIGQEISKQDIASLTESITVFTERANKHSEIAPLVLLAICGWHE